jgi:hypothetical protein
MSNKPILKFVVSVYGQTGYVDAERFNQSERNMFPLLNELGENIKVDEDQNEVVHRGNITADYELVDDYVLVYTAAHRVWEAYSRTTSFPAPYVTSAKTLTELKHKLAAYIDEASNSLDSVILRLAMACESGDKELEVLTDALSTAIDQLKNNPVALSRVAQAAQDALGDDLDDIAFSCSQTDIHDLDAFCQYSSTASLSNVDDQYRVIGVSTAHLSESDRSMLETLSTNPDCNMVMGQESGWFIKLYEEPENNTGYAGMSDNFHQLLNKVHESGYRMVEFNCDADVHEALPTF